MVRFRFQDLEIWKMSIEITDVLFDIADQLEDKRMYRFAEQLRGAGLSISNNIAEGSGSDSNKLFNYYLRIARKSTFENANIVIVLNRRNLISKDTASEILKKPGSLIQDDHKFSKNLKVIKL